MGLATKRSRKQQQEVEEMEEEEEFYGSEGSSEDESNLESDMGEGEKEDEDDEDEENGRVTMEKRDGSHGGGELKELEKEYMSFRNEQQSLLKDLKRHKDEDLLKGQAVKNQKARVQVSTAKGILKFKQVASGTCKVPEESGTGREEDANTDGDAELIDDSEFYQQLLKEFFESSDVTSSETAFYALKRLQTKKRKIVDRHASNSRKIRYNVHEKIVNFMASKPTKLPQMAPMLFSNLFGLRNQDAASVM